jgi:hypothetical protein
VATVNAKTKNGFLVEMTLDEINGLLGLKQDNYNFGDEVDVAELLKRMAFLEASDAGTKELISKAKTLIADYEVAGGR